MYSPYVFAIIFFFATETFAHMQLVSPAPFNASNNQHRLTVADPYLQYPYDCCGPNNRWVYPCRGYLNLLDTPQGAPTAQWPAGSTQTWNISGIGNHWGGSCQVGFSIDKGKTFHVAASYEGNCPRRLNGDGAVGQNFDFTVPADLPVGTQVFAWVWYNREQELNMNCAAVHITASSCFNPHVISVANSAPVSFNERPLMLIANNGNGCLTPKTTAEVKYPHAGPHVVMGDGVYPLELPTGNCDPPAMLAHRSYDGPKIEDGYEESDALRGRQRISIDNRG